MGGGGTGNVLRRRRGSERSLGPMWLREEFVEGLGSLVEISVRRSNNTDEFRDEYSRTIRWSDGHLHKSK